MTTKHYGYINDVGIAIDIHRFYIKSCMDRARWWRDEGRASRPHWRDRMTREVNEARRLSQRLRALLREQAEQEAA